MKNDKMLKVGFKGLILIFIIPLILGASLFSLYLQRILRQMLEKKGHDTVIRLLSYKGLFGIFELMGLSSAVSKAKKNSKIPHRS
ncbi:MAG: hypothetical protein ACTSQI_14330 [Candidatus Helarchaeota archaeon]